MSNFAFLQAEWPEVFEAATKAESLVYPDARVACFYARRALELAVAWLYQHDRTLRLPYQDHLSALIHDPSFRQVAGPAVFTKAKLIKDLGNEAVHRAGPVRESGALTAVRELFHVAYWLARTYARAAKPAGRWEFDERHLPRTSPVPPQTRAQLQSLADQLAASDARLTALLSDKAALDEELTRLREEVAQAKAANIAQPDTHDYSEAETRTAFIDLLLREAGWTLDQPRDREYSVTGMPSADGRGFVDYVLWGDDGLPLGLVEAKRTTRDARAGQQQAKLYADCLEQRYGQRPIIFYSNGYEHWLWDELNYPPRQVQGFLTIKELEQIIQRRSTRLPLAGATIDPAIVERYYQIRAIRRIAEAFERDRDRKALLVMATGAGKTRTVVALSDLLMRCNWVKRVLFLADRRPLVTQAVNAFKRHLPAASPVNLITEKNKDGRVYVSTYPTMMGLIDETRDGQRAFGPGYFDLVVIDEAHRSVYQKYRAIFEYFDALLVGLTATPKDEIDRNTYGLFDLESSVPTDAYGLEEAVKDGYLVPPRAVAVPLKFQQEGIRYDDLTEEEREQWDALEWTEDGPAPDRVEAAAINAWLFNQDTVDKALEYLMTRGLTVAGGDRLGKTIIFARNHAHAVFIQDRFNANYPHYRGQFARVIDVQVDYADTLIDDFSQPEKSPHIAISVDMLDTGIDVPEVVNLVFFKPVRSKTKFWQMLGRGTRLRPDLFGPGQDKEFFYLFDFCGNLEFFSQNPETAGGGSGASLSTRLFRQRLDLIATLDRMQASTDVRRETAELLRNQVAAMNVENFVVRHHRQLVEKYASTDAWSALSTGEIDALSRHVAGLPTARLDTDEEAKRFDLLILRLQLALLRDEPAVARLRDQVRTIAALLEEKSSIPMVRDELSLIQEIQTDAWWQDVIVSMLETARKQLRRLVTFIDKGRRPVLYTDFTDETGVEATVDLPGLTPGTDFERFRAKTRTFLLAHQDDLVIHKLMWNRPLTATDLDELERVLIDAGVGTPDDIDRAKQESSGLGLFIRSLAGLHRDAAKEALGRFVSGDTFSANQIEFVNLIVDQLAERGIIDPGLLWESPFIDIDDRGPEAVFTSSDLDDLLAILKDVRQRATA
ncbi:MAG: DEAD/DEAH box helicase family protein [Dehalococcoidia bacterium]